MSRRTFLASAGAVAAAPFAPDINTHPASAAASQTSPATSGRIFYVSPAGDDTGPGTVRRPFKTLEHARDAVRAFKQRRPRGDITVFFRAGRYDVTETVVFGVADSGNEHQTITYAAHPGERPVFSAAAAVTGWHRLSDLPPGLPAPAVGHVWAADVPSGWRFKALYDDGQLVPVARSAAFRPRGPVSFDVTETNLTHVDYPLTFTPPSLSVGSGSLTDVELFLMPTAPWMVNILPLAADDPLNHTATTQVPGRYPLGPTGHPGPSAWFQNAIGYLDTPGEWVLNTAEGKLYYWPIDGEPGDVRAPLLKQLVVVEGEIDELGPVDRPVTNLGFRGLTFTGGDRDTWPSDYRGREMQHAWDLFDGENGLVQFRGVEDSAIVDCEFTHSGHNAIRCDRHCQRVEIAGNLIHDVGASGIIVAGYGPGTKDVNHHNVVRNNEVFNTGRLYWHGLGIWLWQSGENRVENNLVHATPYTGIAVSGRISFNRLNPEAEGVRTVRWDEIDAITGGGPLNTYDAQEPFLHTRNNVVEDNDVSDVMTSLLSDGNGIYVSGAARGNVIRRNYIHDVGSPRLQAGFRTDDVQYDTTFAENVIARTAGHYGMVLKQRNDFVNNIVADLRAPDSAYLAMIIGPVAGSRLQRNVFYSTIAGQTIVKEGPAYVGADPQLETTECDFNDYFSTADPTWGAAHLQAFQPEGIEQASLAVDPQFYDIAQSDFRLRPGSPPLGTGFNQIDMLPIGPTAEFAYGKPDDDLDRLFVRSGDHFASIHLAPLRFAALEVAGRTVSGYRADLRSARIRYASDNWATALVGPFGGGVLALRPGVAHITVSATKGGVTKSTSIVVIVG